MRQENRELLRSDRRPLERDEATVVGLLGDVRDRLDRIEGRVRNGQSGTRAPIVRPAQPRSRPDEGSCRSEQVTGCGADVAGVSSATLGAARRLTDSVLAELAQWLGRPRLPLNRSGYGQETGPLGDEEFIRSVWQEVGDDFRDAMREYPLDRAASNARENGGRQDSSERLEPSAAYAGRWRVASML